MGHYLPIHIATLDSWMHYKFESQPMSYSLNISTAEWTTLCLPFSFDVPDNIKLYSVTGMREDGTLSLVQTATPEANKPYLVRGEAGTYILSGYTEEANEQSEDYLRNNLLQGCHIGKYAPKDTYVLQNQNGKVAFYRVEENGKVHVGEHKAWLVPDKEALTRQFSFNLDEKATGLVEITDNQTGRMNIYSADGRLVTHPVKGLNIIKYTNGKTKKMIVK